MPGEEVVDEDDGEDEDGNGDHVTAATLTNITRSECSIKDFVDLFKAESHSCLAPGKADAPKPEGIFNQNENEDMKKVSDSLMVTYICLFRMQVQWTKTPWPWRM